MTIKILAFGQQQQLNKFIEQSRNAGSSGNQEQTVIVQNVTIEEVQYLLFAVKERALVTEQATGTNGLIFFIGAETPLFEEKQYLVDLLSSKAEFDNIPVAVIFERGQRLTLKDVVNYMELYRFKDRASMIKEINWTETQWIAEIYGWIKTQSENLIGKGFHAVPKVVKVKPKYRQFTQQQSEKKYQGMLNEKQLRSLGVKQQEEVYIERQKDKIKQDNMEKQLSNFSRNKKKMAPYDIKPTPNPKIQPNLHFFLKDPNAKPPAEASIKIQTDQFKERNPPAPYKPKKTGINISTQIQKNELFSFDKQVRPILAILTTKALETAALQIQQEEQLLKMSKYKMAYEQRVKRQKEHEQKNIDQQLKIIKQKQKLLADHRNRAEKIKNIQYRTQCYSIASNFLQNVYFQSTKKLIVANAYPDQLDNFLHLDYLNEIIGKAVVAYDRIIVNESALKNVFDSEVVEGITKIANNLKVERSKIEKIRQNRLGNKLSATRRFHVLYKHDYPQFSNFSKYLSKNFDGTLDEYTKSREEHIQEMSDKVSNGETTQEQFLKLKMKDNIDFANSGHQCYVLNHQKELCFTWTSNKFEKSKEDFLEKGLIFLDKDGQFVDSPIFGKVNPNHQSFLRNQEGLRQPRQPINMDHGYTINLSKVPENIKTILILAKYNQIQRFKNETQAKKVKGSAYGVQLWQRNTKIHNKNIGEGLKWQQIVKSVEGEQVVAQNLYVVSYVLRRRVVPEYWNLEDISYVSQPIKSIEEFNHFAEELSRFYYRSNDFLKEEEEDEKIERATSSQQKKSSNNQRTKSKKVIEEPKKIIVLKVSTRILREIQINIQEPFDNVMKKITGVVQQWKQFMESCENGWQILVKGERLVDTEQLSHFSKIGDVVIKRVAKIQQPKIQKIDEVQKEEVQQ